MGTIDTKPTLITGASRGFGAALARALAEREWPLILDARGNKDLVRVAGELSLHTDVTAIPGDVTDVAHRQQLVVAAKRAGGLRALVNNAGTLGPSPLPELLDFPLEALAEIYRINAIAPLAMIQALAPYLGEDARIVNITSDAAVEAYAGWGGYGAGKAALEQIGNVLAAEKPE